MGVNTDLTQSIISRIIKQMPKRAIFQIQHTITMNSFTLFLKQTRTELNHVTWLSGKQVALFTVAVIVLSLLLAYMLGGFDIVLHLGLAKLLAR